MRVKLILTFLTQASPLLKVIRFRVDNTANTGHVLKQLYHLSTGLLGTAFTMIAFLITISKSWSD